MSIQNQAFAKMGTNEVEAPPQVSGTSRSSRRRLNWPALILLPLLLIVLVSCVRRKEEPVFMYGSEDVTLSGSATLKCSDGCRDSGQCGTIDTAWIILSSTTGPATTSHDRTFPDNSAVEIIQQRMEIVQSVSDPSLTDRQAFYEVNVPDLGTGWVAGWCIGQLIVP